MMIAQPGSGRRGYVRTGSHSDNGHVFRLRKLFRVKLYRQCDSCREFRFQFAVSNCWGKLSMRVRTVEPMMKSIVQ